MSLLGRVAGGEGGCSLGFIACSRRADVAQTSVSTDQPSIRHDQKDIRQIFQRSTGTRLCLLSVGWLGVTVAGVVCVRGGN